VSTLRRLSALTVASTVIAAFLGVVPARAQETTTQTLAPEAFVASASARGLELSLFGTQLTIGSAGSLIDSSPKAQGQGAGVLLVGGTVANALVTAVNQSQDPPPACVLNVPLGLVDLAVACGDTAVSTANGLPQAVSSGAIASLDIGLSLLGPLVDQLAALLDQTIASVLDPLLALLGNLLNPLLGALNLNTDSLVSDLLAGLQRATGVLSVRLGPSVAAAATDESKVRSEGKAEGAVIELLPGLSELGAPLATITVGAARASVDVTRPAASDTGAVTAVATPSFDAALVSVALGLPILGDVTTIPVGLGAPLVLLAGTPLETRISLGAGSTADGPNGTKVAVADGVSIQALIGLNGGIGLSLAHAEAAGGGVSAVISVQQKVVPQPVVVPELARTGGREPWVPMLGAGLLLAALVTRRMVRPGVGVGPARGGGRTRVSAGRR
jgi:hypothetical protein